MRILAAIFVTAAATASLAAPVTANAWCQAEVCTDPVGHFTKPVQPVLDTLPDPGR